MIAYVPEDGGDGHCAIITKQDNGKWDTNDEQLKTDQHRPWKLGWLCTINTPTM